MNTFASTFVSGLNTPVCEALRQLIPDVNIIKSYDGLLVYTTNSNIEAVKNIKYFNNTFLAIKIFENLKVCNFNNMISRAAGIKDLKKRIGRECIRHGSKFRIVASDRNRLVPVNGGLLKEMEYAVTKATGLKVDRCKPDLEFWFLHRSEGAGFFMLRLTKHASTEKLLKKGELRPELCYILNHLSEPDANDAFLDPFCGYGSIPIARCHMLSFKTIYASDSDVEKVRDLKSKTALIKGQKGFAIKKEDALHMKSLNDRSIDKIVTDPPWALYEKIYADIEAFYMHMIEEFYRVLKIHGIMIILTARKEEFEKALRKVGERLELQNKFDILVSGKKAAVYKITKRI